jgi:glucose-6-phosphate 1-dehydrogenase
MQNIRPSIAEQDIVCDETTAPPTAMIVFGASGDLAKRKLFVSLFQLFNRGLLSEYFYLLGAGRKKLSDQTFRQSAQQAIQEGSGNLPSKEIEAFVSKLYYVSGDYGDISFYENIKTNLIELDKKHKIDGGDPASREPCHIFYLAVPPFLYTTIVEKLGSVTLSCPREPDSRQPPRLVVEKPFGRDLQSATDLNNKIHQCFDESQIYRIDHYLGKETVQNILMFRFANAIFEPVWNRNYIDHVQITIAESLGIEHRGSYYDKVGALRDMFQNHMLQMLALAAMEPPASFEADSIRDEKVKLLRSVRPFKLEPWSTIIVRGQYGSGVINGKEVVGYQSESNVEPGSKTETFVAAKLFIDNWRWKDVPFYLRTGKRLARKNTEVAIIFKKVPHSMFVSTGLAEAPNVLVLQIQPEEGVSLSFQAKRPGSKICMSTLNMDFNYRTVFGVDMPGAYQRLLLDCMAGDQTLFTRADDVNVTWRLLTPILQAWGNDDSPPYEYPAGSESFPAADLLIESDGRRWRKFPTI